eukprot:269103_1
MLKNASRTVARLSRSSFGALSVAKRSYIIKKPDVEPEWALGLEENMKKPADIDPKLKSKMEELGFDTARPWDTIDYSMRDCKLDLLERPKEFPFKAELEKKAGIKIVEDDLSTGWETSEIDHVFEVMQAAEKHMKRPQIIDMICWITNFYPLADKGYDAKGGKPLDPNFKLP